MVEDADVRVGRSNVGWQFGGLGFDVGDIAGGDVEI